MNQVNDTAKFLYGVDDRLFGIGNDLGLVEGHVDLDGNLAWTAVPDAADAIGTDLLGCSIAIDSRNGDSAAKIYAWNGSTLFKGTESDDHEHTSLSVWFDQLPSTPTSMLGLEAASTYSSFGVNTIKFFVSGFDKMYDDDVVFTSSTGALYLNRQRALKLAKPSLASDLQCSMLVVDPENRNRIFRVANVEDDGAYYISSAIYPSLTSVIPCYESTSRIERLLIAGQNAMLQDESSASLRYGAIDYTTDRI